MNIAGILFDFDLTLVDLGINGKYWEQLKLETEPVFRKYNIKTDSLTMWELLMKVDLNLFSFPPESTRKLKYDLYPIILKVELRQVEKATLMPGAKKVLEQLKARNLPFGIVSNNFHKTIANVIKKLLNGFDDILIIGRDDVENVKPHPEPLQKALNILKIKESDSIYVGDSTVDIKAGKSAGMFTAGIVNKYTTADDLKKSGADIVCNRIDEILDLIKT